MYKVSRNEFKMIFFIFCIHIWILVDSVNKYFIYLLFYKSMKPTKSTVRSQILY